jgi:hypothetical protein
MVENQNIRMAFSQNALSKKFVEEVKSLVKSGKAGKAKDIAAKLDYNYSALIQILGANRNVPDHVYQKFTETYKPVDVKESTVLEVALQNQAMSRVILRALAELLSSQRDESVTKTLGDLEAAVKVEIQQVSGR